VFGKFPNVSNLRLQGGIVEQFWQTATDEDCSRLKTLWIDEFSQTFESKTLLLRNLSCLNVECHLRDRHLKDFLLCLPNFDQLRFLYFGMSKRGADIDDLASATWNVRSNVNTLFLALKTDFPAASADKLITIISRVFSNVVHLRLLGPEPVKAGMYHLLSCRNLQSVSFGLRTRRDPLKYQQILPKRESIEEVNQEKAKREFWAPYYRFQ
jgi:hypothetical protein